VAGAAYRLKNEHDKAEQVLRGILKTDPENELAVEQLTQLLMDEGKSAEAVALLEGIAGHSPSPVLLDLLGMRTRRHMTSRRRNKRTERRRNWIRPS